MGSLLAKDRLEEARYYAWIDEIGSHAFELEFAGSGGVRYVSTCDTNNGNYYSGTQWAILASWNNPSAGYVTAKGASASPDVTSGKIAMNVKPRPGDTKVDAGEWANLEIREVDWGWKNIWDAKGETDAKIEIKDGAICLITTDSNNNGSIDAADNDPKWKNSADYPGRMLRINDDDGDKNSAAVRRAAQQDAGGFRA